MPSGFAIEAISQQRAATPLQGTWLYKLLGWGTEQKAALGRPWLGEEPVDTALSPCFPPYPRRLPERERGNDERKRERPLLPEYLRLRSRRRARHCHHLLLNAARPALLKPDLAMWGPDPPRTMLNLSPPTGGGARRRSRRRRPSKTTPRRRCPRLALAAEGEEEREREREEGRAVRATNDGRRERGGVDGDERRAKGERRSRRWCDSPPHRPRRQSSGSGGGGGWGGRGGRRRRWLGRARREAVVVIGEGEEGGGGGGLGGRGDRRRARDRERLATRR